MVKHLDTVAGSTHNRYHVHNHFTNEEFELTKENMEKLRGWFPVAGIIGPLKKNFEAAAKEAAKQKQEWLRQQKLKREKEKVRKQENDLGSAAADLEERQHHSQPYNARDSKMMEKSPRSFASVRAPKSGTDEELSQGHIPLDDLLEESELQAQRGQLQGGSDRSRSKVKYYTQAVVSVLDEHHETYKESPHLFAIVDLC